MKGLFRSSRDSSLPRPALWRLSLIQCLAWLLALGLSALFWSEYTTSIGWGGLISLVAQAFWIWRSLRSFGDPQSMKYLTGTTAGLIGKWAIILIGLVALWRSQPDISVAATVITVFGLNTLAALAAPISISQPR